ncbi:MAG TPA: malto-oligosyltrehalose synthase, partial [Dehalococcoidia bacterium]|nr:malto-oligosyltrehalose synthase [Dehalococcoidia bacterium]
LILDLVARGSVDGLRIDHIDGLRDPLRYLERLDGLMPEGRIVVEKILEDGEQLRDDWPVDGTTGYDFLNQLNGLFVEPAAEATLTGLYRDLTGVSADYESVLADKKRLVLAQLFAGDVAHLVDLFDACCPTAEWSRGAIESAIRETIVALPVYRTYARLDDQALTEEDARLLTAACDDAQAALPNVPPGVFDALRGMLRIDRTGENQARAAEFLPAFQELSGPAMAKGAEDTAFYNYNRFVALNEVGGNPGILGTGLEAFHMACASNAGRWPLTMLATSTHDTKRGEDTRLRIDALSELPVEWSVFVHRAMQAHEGYRTGGAPDNNARYLLYQTLAGAWPIDPDRANAYMLKAMREAKAFTSWHDPDEAYERAMNSYVDAVFTDQGFVSECSEFVARIDAIARVSSLAQTLLKLTAPGIPDFYQGAELWEHSLVDPDNRRPVDYESQHRLLEELPRMTAQEAMDQADSGIPKLWLIWKTLAFRRRYYEAFAGAYTPLLAEGAKADCVVAFMRAGEVVTVAPRLVGRLQDGWRDTVLRLPEGRWLNVLTEETTPSGEVALSDLMRDFPVALLSREDSS